VSALVGAVVGVLAAEDVSALDDVWAGLAAFAAGAVNAIAGGGTLITFPTLVAIGIPTVSANVTNTVALCPGYLGGAHAQRAELAGQSGLLRRLALVGVAGSLLGSALLLATSDETFEFVVPFLILLACGLLLLQDRLRAAVDRHRPHGAHGASLPTVMFAAAAYGGYFGAGLGIMMLAVLGILLAEPMRRLNAVKSSMALLINGVAAVFFVFSGEVVWEVTPIMAVTSLVGGHVGGRIASRLDPRLFRLLVVAFGLAVAVKFWFF
jgi:uncharacterized membrane protein YfcA